MGGADIQGVIPWWPKATIGAEGPPAREAGVPPAGTSVRRAQRAVYASDYKLSLDLTLPREDPKNTHLI